MSISKERDYQTVRIGYYLSLELSLSEQLLPRGERKIGIGVGNTLCRESWAGVLLDFDGQTPNGSFLERARDRDCGMERSVAESRCSIYNVLSVLQTRTKFLRTYNSADGVE